MSRQFIELIEERIGWGKSLINPTGTGPLSAANPQNSGVAPMQVVGSCLLPQVFAPVDQIFRVKFSVLKGLPYAIVLGAAFMKDNRSIVSFDGERVSGRHHPHRGYHSPWRRAERLRQQ